MVGTMASHFKTHDVEMDSFCVGESLENAKYTHMG